MIFFFLKVWTQRIMFFNSKLQNKPFLYGYVPRPVNQMLWNESEKLTCIVFMRDKPDLVFMDLLIWS